MHILKHCNMDIAKKNMLMTAELIKVMKVLEKNNIEAIAFKGPVLSQIAYGDITLRQYVDLDILVNKKNINKAVNILLSNGFNTADNISYLEKDIFYKIGKDIQFFHTQNNVSIELHWELFEEKLFSRKNNIFTSYTKYKINNYDTTLLNQELNFLYLCIHGAKHGWERIEWLVDLDRLLRKQELDMTQIIKYAKDTHSTKILFSSLYLVKILFNNTLKNLDLYIKDLSIEHLANSFLIDWNEHETKKQFFRINYKQINDIIRIQDNIFMKLKKILKLFFELKIYDVQYIDIPDKLSLLYYIIRPVRLVHDFIKHIIKR